MESGESAFSRRTKELEEAMRLPGSKQPIEHVAVSDLPQQPGERWLMDFMGDQPYMVDPQGNRRPATAEEQKDFTRQLMGEAPAAGMPVIDQMPAEDTESGAGAGGPEEGIRTAGEDTGRRESEEVRSTRRIAARQDLRARLGPPDEIPGVTGAARFFWREPDGSVSVVLPDGNVELIAVGGVNDFSTRDNPNASKRWTAAGWEDAPTSSRDPEPEAIQGEENATRPAQAAPEAPAPPPRTHIEHHPRQGVVPDFIGRAYSRTQPRQEPLIRHEPPALSEILTDSKKQGDFYKLIEVRGRADLVTKLASAMNERTDPATAMTADDWNEINAARAEYERRTQFSEELRSGIRQEEVLFMIQTEPAFAFLKNSVTPERAAELIQQNMDAVVMGATETELDGIVYAHRSNLDIRASAQFQRLTERARLELNNQGVKVEEIKWEELEKLNPEILGRVQRRGFLEWITRRESSTRLTRDAYTTNLKAVSEILGSTLSQDKELQRRVIREAQTGVRVTNIPTGPGTYQEYQRERAGAQRNFNLPALRASVPEFKRTYRDRFGVGWNEHTPEQRENNFYGSLEGGEKRANEYRSWFGALLAAFLGTMLSRAKGDGQLKNAFRQA